MCVSCLHNVFSGINNFSAIISSYQISISVYVFVYRNIISGSCSMLEAARALALSPQERAQWQALAAHSKTVSDSIKALVTNIRLVSSTNMLQIYPTLVYSLSAVPFIRFE